MRGKCELFAGFIRVRLYLREILTFHDDKMYEPVSVARIFPLHIVIRSSLRYPAKEMKIDRLKLDV